MRSLKLEQVAVIKFLTLEGSDVDEIYERLKNIFQKFTLLKEKVVKLNMRFDREGLLGNYAEPLYLEHFENTERESSLEFSDELNYSLSDSNYDNNNFFLNDEECSDLEVKSEEYIKHIDYEPYQNVKSEEMTLNNEPLETSLSLKRKAVNDNMQKPLKSKICVKDLEHKSQIRLNSRTLRNKNSRSKELMSVLKGSDVELPFLPVMSYTLSEELLYRMHQSTLCCMLCENNSFNVYSKLKRHLKNAHLRHSVILSTVRSLQCKKHCHCLSSRRQTDVTTRAHYHCPLCSWYFSCRQRLVRHHSTHLTQSEKYAFPGEFDRVKQKFRCVGVDVNEGIYLVCKSRFKNLQPVHVMKKNCTGDSGNETVYRAECSEELCQEAMELARKNGNHSLECKHLANVDLEAKVQFPQNFFTLNEDSFKNLSYSLNAEEFQSCMALSEASVQINTPLLVEWVDTDTVIFFSIFCDEPFATMGRMMVKLDTDMNTFSCNCPFNSSHFCPYKVISEIYFLSANENTYTEDSMLL